MLSSREKSHGGSIPSSSAIFNMYHDKELNYFTVQGKNAIIKFIADRILLFKGHIEYEEENIGIPLLLEGHMVDTVISNLKKLPPEQHTLEWLRNTVTGCIYISLKCSTNERNLWK